MAIQILVTLTTMPEDEDGSDLMDALLGNYRRPDGSARDIFLEAGSAEFEIEKLELVKEL